ncbi:hypothetical protein SESBI_08059 [Sesbania bispinosa]|nr:hypothetical protein SESBI_08059 [Sesbania bispinosa]
MDPDPPDGDRPAHSPKASFKDKLLNNQGSFSSYVDLIGHNLFRIELEDGNRLKPKCFVADSVLQNLRKSWSEAIIIKLLEKVLTPQNPELSSIIPPEAVLEDASKVESKESDHGEWLVVNRTKKGRQNKSKVKASLKDLGQNQNDRDKAFQDKGKEKKSGNPSAKEEGIKAKASLKDLGQNQNDKDKALKDKGKEKKLGNSSAKEEEILSSRLVVSKEKVLNMGNSASQDRGMIFSSQALTFPTNGAGRKKRHRVDNSSTLSSAELIEVPHFKQLTMSNQKPVAVFENQIKTAMNVDFIAPNRLRFKDADDPPDCNDPEQFENALDHHMENGSDEGAIGENFTVSTDHDSHE